MAERPRLTAFWMEWQFDGESPAYTDEEMQRQILEDMSTDGAMAFPVEHAGEVVGFMRPVQVLFLNDGHIMRVRFDTDDVALPVYPDPSNPE